MNIGEAVIFMRAGKKLASQTDLLTEDWGIVQYD